MLFRISQREIYVGHAANKIVATVGLGDNKLYALFVLPEEQGKGIGASLLAYVESLMRARGFSEVVTSSSLTAIQFYKNRGYADIAYEEKPFASTWLMKKTL
jgi:GNAT superfamily N-acetyltransferase